MRAYARALVLWSLSWSASACLGSADVLGGDDDGQDADAPPASDDGLGEGQTVASPTSAERYARARCAAMTACDCPEDAFASVGDCERVVAASFRYLQSSMDGAELDVGCLEEVLAFLDEAPCGLATDLVADGRVPACFTYRGRSESGELCSRNAGVLVHADTCATGLSCQLTVAGHRCRNEDAAPAPVAQGDPCGIGQTPTADCGPSLYCDPDSLTCELRAGPGEPCDNGTACLAGSWCSGALSAGMAHCEPLIPIGEGCSHSLSCAPALCEDGLCEPGVCLDGLCAEPLPLICHALYV